MKKWLMVIRAPFLPLSVALAFLGTCIAWYYGAFHLGHALLAGFGLLLAHISVDVLNEYFDYRSGVDLRTQRTPFSGGSGALPQGLVTPRQALWLGFGTLVAIVPIGIYFTLTKGWALAPLLVVAAILIVFYTPFILKMGWPEWAPGVGMGSLPVLGAFFIQTGEYTLPAVIAAIPSGILVHNLLLLNEFPDVEADASANRRTLPIVAGKRKASLFYSAMTVLVYLWIIGGVIACKMPAFSLLGLLTLPMAARAILGSMKYDDASKFMPAMASNVQVVLITQFLMGIGYILARIVGG
ncbi:MAG: prenyltransferase [Dehalococcoidales bacterium]|nr:MAG: prenyltransferase [Dehalococcoidales bacterium]